jgi:hypothetical protein
VLERIGLLEQSPEGYRPTPGARRAILGTYRAESWALLAQEERERFPSVHDLANRMTLLPGAAGLPGPAPDYVQLMAADPERARVFTRMLYDLHGPLARCLAGALDLGGAERLLDLGGGSGVVSLALLRQNPGLEIVVMDIPTVCAEGRRIAREESLEDRIAFLEGDLLAGELPRGFDAVLECDVGVYQPDLFTAVRESLQVEGRFFVADLLPEAEDDFPERVLHWGFTASIAAPERRPMTWPRLAEMLEAAGLRPGPAVPLIEGFRLLEARR